mmetsp:Transcript_7987/g.11767  ORF Transcript_7987/g.11767 Transcript_7987/m.11767 type:complete len:282 (+) Transcript_7987:61-906(+)
MNASRTTEPNIIDFMRAIGEKQTSNMRRNMKLYTDRKVLRLSAQWASAVTKQRNKILYINNPYRSDYKIDKALSSLSPECATLEIRAIDLLSSIEAKSTHMSSSLTKADDDKYNGTLYGEEEEDDYLSAELASLDESTRLLQLELESVQIQPSPYNHHHHHHSDEYDANNASRAGELTYYEVPEQHVAQQHELLEPQPIIRRRMPTKSLINWSPRSSYDETSFHKVVVGKRGPASYEQRCVTLPDFSSSNVGRNNIMPIPLDLPVLSHLTFTSEIRSGFLN